MQSRFNIRLSRNPIPLFFHFYYHRSGSRAVVLFDSFHAVLSQLTHPFLVIPKSDGSAIPGHPSRPSFSHLRLPSLGPKGAHFQEFNPQGLFPAQTLSFSFGCLPSLHRLFRSSSLRTHATTTPAHRKSRYPRRRTGMSRLPRAPQFQLQVARGKASCRARMRPLTARGRYPDLLNLTLCYLSVA